MGEQRVGAASAVAVRAMARARTGRAAASVVVVRVMARSGRAASSVVAVPRAVAKTARVATSVDAATTRAATAHVAVYAAVETRMARAVASAAGVRKAMDLVGPGAMEVPVVPRAPSRRAVLRGALGGAAVSLALPTLEALLPGAGPYARAQSAALPGFFGVFFWANGTPWHAAHGGEQAQAGHPDRLRRRGSGRPRRVIGSPRRPCRSFTCHLGGT